MTSRIVVFPYVFFSAFLSYFSSQEIWLKFWKTTENISDTLKFVFLNEKLFLYIFYHLT